MKPAAQETTSVARFRELSAPGRTLNLFESVELETLERQFGQPLLPLTPKTMPKSSKPKVRPSGSDESLEANKTFPVEPMPEGVDMIVTADRIDRSPWNRNHFTEESDAEMEASIRVHGIISRPLLRPQPGNDPNKPEESRYQLVAGERRWRGAKRIDSAYPLPVTVKPLSDRQALELQKVENLQREDLDPIEEGRGLKQMMVEFGYSIEHLVQQLGRSKSHIYGRLKLGNLCDKAATLYRLEAFPESVALRIARLPSVGMQERFLDKVRLLGKSGEPEWDKAEDEPVRDSEAARIIGDKFIRQLKGAPFNPTDPALLPVETNESGERVAGGSCADCPFRAGNQEDYDADNCRPDMCLNLECFHRKAEIAFQQKVEKHSEVGGESIADNEKLVGIFSNWDGGVCSSSGYNDGSAHFYAAKLPGKETSGTFLQIAKAVNVQPILALNPHTGKVHNLIDTEAVTEAAKKAGLISGRGTSRLSAMEKAAREKSERLKQVRAAQVTAVVETIQGAPAKVLQSNLQGWLQVVTARLADRADADTCRLICKRRNIDPKLHKKQEYDNGQRNAVEKLGTQALEVAECMVLVTELLSSICWNQDGDPLTGIADLFSVNLKKVERETTEALDAKKRNPKLGKGKLHPDQTHPLTLALVARIKKDKAKAAAKAKSKAKRKAVSK